MNLKEQLQNQRALIASMSIALVALVLALAVAGYAWSHNGRYYRGVTVGSVNLGGLTFEEGRALVNAELDAILDAGAEVEIEGETKTIALRTTSIEDPDLSRELVIVNVDQALTEAQSVGRSGNMGERGLELMQALILSKTVMPGAVVDKDALEDALISQFEAYYSPAEEPTFVIEEGDDTWEVTVQEGSAGRAFDVDSAVERLKERTANLQSGTLRIAIQDQEPSISAEDAEALAKDAVAALEATPYTLTYTPDRFETFSYTVSDTLLVEALTPEMHEDAPRLGLNETIEALFEEVTDEINIAPQNARFKTDGDVVEEFLPSKTGRTVDEEATYENLITAINNPVVDNAEEEEEEEEEEEADTVLIVVNETEADITTASVNDLGITEILGVGISDFSGSPANRIANIRHGISKLNGVLIAPDEEFSLISRLKPFTIADGYLPELVIKGDEIKPEIGGGLCQIGSTTFRAVMNSGLEITERRNHSLVVSYYNDPSNGNPGTDATLYDPAPDFKFVNDTGNYILLSTEMDVSTGRLAFTFWGTSDGRKGYYSPPVVHNWIGTGPTQTTYSTSLPPGVRRCQGAHPGANTSFTYTVERPDGTVDERVFESYYRPLPTICVVGVAEGSLDEDGNLIETPAESTGEDAETPATETEVPAETPAEEVEA